MPLQFDRDDVNRRVKIKVSEPIAAADLIASAERQLAEGAWPYGMLVDTRAMTVPPPPADVQLFVSRVRELVATHGPRGPVALVARHSAVIGSVQVYKLFGGKIDSLEVFWDVSEARQWLDQQMAPRGVSSNAPDNCT